ncbi:MAG: dTDP-glucose 4,6-dehydratase [Rickettsiales bacterium]|nr:dTDP-glucose 4,6-dehydratase [Rickettsiales bacterium]|tara:strand:+ start:2486 stop:3511 length:1026 start_codon:yes stop_codon:yes gene_type:complete
MNLLITGGSGFIGSHFIHHLLTLDKGYSIFNLDKLTYAHCDSHLDSLKGHPKYTFIQGDICNQDHVNDLFKTFQFQGVIHFAAESHVDNSISGPEVFIDTNIKGTYNLIHAAKTLWMNAPFEQKESFKTARFHHISTDEVFGSLGSTGTFSESTAYAPNSPYSASKASSDFIVRSYHHTFGLNITISNCSNNYGPFQHDEKLIPTIIRNALNHNPIPIYGDGKNIRDWLYVKDHATAICDIFFKGNSGETYNIGTRNEQKNIDLCQHICAKLDQLHPSTQLTSYKDLITYVKDRPGHDKRYAIDSTKIESELGWSALADFDTYLEETISFYIKKYNNVKTR